MCYMSIKALGKRINFDLFLIISNYITNLFIFRFEFKFAWPWWGFRQFRSLLLVKVIESLSKVAVILTRLEMLFWPCLSLSLRTLPSFSHRHWMTWIFFQILLDRLGWLIRHHKFTLLHTSNTEIKLVWSIRHNWMFLGSVASLSNPYCPQSEGLRHTLQI
jgi:hypothetical protein